MFPDFAEGNNFEFTSEVDVNYNCLSWALGVNSYCFENARGATWPWKDIPDDTAEGWAAFLVKLGFTPCTDDSLVEQVYKVAIMRNDDGDLHAARQEPDGRWKSKLGVWGPDVDHADLESLSPAYGEVVHLLCKKR